MEFVNGVSYPSASNFLSFVQAIPKLTGSENFIMWHGQVGQCALMFGMLRVLEVRGDYGIYDKYGLALITMSISQDVLDMLYMKGLKMSTTAHEAMQIIYGLFASGDRVEVAELKDQLELLDAGNYTTMWAYLAFARRVIFHLLMFNEGRDERYIVNCLLGGLRNCEGPHRELYDDNPVPCYQGVPPPLWVAFAHLEDLARAQEVTFWGNS